MSFLERVINNKYAMLYDKSKSLSENAEFIGKYRQEERKRRKNENSKENP